NRSVGPYSPAPTARAPRAVGRNEAIRGALFFIPREQRRSEETPQLLGTAPDLVELYGGIAAPELVSANVTEMLLTCCRGATALLLTPSSVCLLCTAHPPRRPDGLTCLEPGLLFAGA